MVAATIDGDAGGGAGEVLFHRCDVSESLDFIVVTPDRPLPTEKARAALPAQYSRHDVVQNLQRVALLTAAFCSGSGLVPELFRDRIHQPYRSALIPGISDCLEFRHEGLAGVFISGAGSRSWPLPRQMLMRLARRWWADFGATALRLARRA